MIMAHDKKQDEMQVLSEKVLSGKASVADMKRFRDLLDQNIEDKKTGKAAKEYFAKILAQIEADGYGREDFIKNTEPPEVIDWSFTDPVKKNKDGTPKVWKRVHGKEDNQFGRDIKVLRRNFKTTEDALSYVLTDDGKAWAMKFFSQENLDDAHKDTQKNPT